MKDDYIKEYRSCTLGISDNEEEVNDLQISSTLNKNSAYSAVTQNDYNSNFIEIRLVISSSLSFESFHEGCFYFPINFYHNWLSIYLENFTHQRLLKCW